MKRRSALASFVLALPVQAAQAWAAFTRGATPQPGGVRIEIAEWVENGNAVPVRVVSEAPVEALALFTTLNPEPDVIQVSFGPAAARYEFATRIRLARSQKLLAVARLADGRCRVGEVEVLVTLAACIEGG